MHAEVNQNFILLVPDRETFGGLLDFMEAALVGLCLIPELVLLLAIKLEVRCMLLFWVAYAGLLAVVTLVLASQHFDQDFRETYSILSAYMAAMTFQALGLIVVCGLHKEMGQDLEGLILGRIGSQGRGRARGQSWQMTQVSIESSVPKVQVEQPGGQVVQIQADTELIAATTGSESVVKHGADETSSGSAPAPAPL